jgi:hypothetical protein
VLADVSSKDRVGIEVIPEFWKWQGRKRSQVSVKSIDVVERVKEGYYVKYEIDCKMILHGVIKKPSRMRNLR